MSAGISDEERNIKLALLHWFEMLIPDLEDVELLGWAADTRRMMKMVSDSLPTAPTEPSPAQENKAGAAHEAVLMAPSSGSLPNTSGPAREDGAPTFTNAEKAQAFEWLRKYALMDDQDFDTRCAAIMTFEVERLHRELTACRAELEMRVCKHGTRWPHECRECELELASRLAQREDEFMKGYDYARKKHQIPLAQRESSDGLADWLEEFTRDLDPLNPACPFSGHEFAMLEKCIATLRARSGEKS